MKIEIFSQGTGTDDFPWGLFIVWTLIWLFTLYRILSRTDLDTATRILWAMVVIFVPIFGVFFYAFLAPSPAPSPSRASSSKKPSGAINLASDVSGTPWANNPSYTQEN